MSAKSAQIKKVSSKKSVPATDETEEINPPAVLKNKSALEIDEPEAVIGLDEKPEEDPLEQVEEGEDAELDDVGLDEEIDPFNDKWEA